MSTQNTTTPLTDLISRFQEAYDKIEDKSLFTAKALLECITEAQSFLPKERETHARIFEEGAMTERNYNWEYHGSIIEEHTGNTKDDFSLPPNPYTLIFDQHGTR